MKRQYLCIDLKSFYASVECVERGLDPLTTNLVVADDSRTEKTICLAVTPSLKAYGISGRARLFEVIQKVKEINIQREYKSFNKKLIGKSYNDSELKKNSSLAVDYIIAHPRMAFYSKYSANIFNIYLKYVAHEDILDYSIDEVFIDVTKYLNTYKMTARELAMTIVKDVFKTTGITATAGIGTNMYLSKIAMDIVAKKMPADKNGVRIAELDEMSYRKELWCHRPLTDFWRIGKGMAKKLETHGMHTMGDIARKSLTIAGEKQLFKLFGKNAEIIIDHAWGREPVTIKDVKSFKPENKSLGAGQVLHIPYDYQKTRIIVQEMLELLALDLVEKGYVTDQIVLTVGYDVENLIDPEIRKVYNGEITTDNYGRKIPKHAHGTANIGRFTSSSILITKATLKLFDEIVNDKLLVRRVNVSANHLTYENEIKEEANYEQLQLFVDYNKRSEDEKREKCKLEKERRIQKTTIELRNKYGKNAILKGINFEDGATTKERNKQIGGHKA